MIKKIAVEVIAAFKRDGYIRPLRIVWEDGREYEIDRIIDVKHRYGWKYVVEVGGFRRTLWLEEKRFKEGMSAAWYVESVVD